MPNLSHNQEVLLTRQRHEADRAGLHYDVRMIVGDLAHSWATKKEMPEPGKAIILWEQPVHDRAYALSKKVVIPKGQYGAGVTTLDWIRKGQISNPEEDEHKFTLSTKNGDRFLFKKLPDSYGKKAWLFKNLTEVEKQASTKPLAIIVTGNPLYLEHSDIKPLAHKFYSDIESRLVNKGFEVKYDPGHNMTLPDTSAQVWVGHSRGHSRLRFGPENIRKIYLKTNNELEGMHPDHYSLHTSDIKNLDSLNSSLEKTSSRATGVCDTPGAIYHSVFSGNNVGMTVTLPEPIHVPVSEMTELEWEMHDALEKILSKYFPKKYSTTRVKNLMKKEASRSLAVSGYQKITQKTILDRVDQNLTKKASLIVGAVGTHLAQNVATRAAMSSKGIGKYLANSFSQGAHGVVDTSLKAKAKRFITGAVVPDIAVAHKKAHEAGTAMKPFLDKATSRQKVGLRMLSEGRISDLKKYNLHKDQLVTQAHGMISKHIKGIPSMDHILDNAKKVEKVFKDKSHPLLSNISANISRGNKPVGGQFKPGTMSAKSSIAGSLSSAIADPAGGALSTVKTLASSNTFNNNKYGHKLNKMIEKQFVSKPIHSGVKSGKPETTFGKIKHKISGLFVNPVSAHLNRTSSAISSSVKS